MRYTLSVNGREFPVDTAEELIRHFELARQEQYAELWLVQKLDPSQKQGGEFAYRLLGLNPPRDNALMGTLINGGRATLVFEDEDDHSSHAFSPDYDGPEGEKVLFFLGNGQRDESPAEECLPVEQALRAFLFFYEAGDKPGWVH
jgi:hypothetical protein